MAAAADNNGIRMMTPSAFFEGLIQPEEGAKRLLADRYLNTDCAGIVAQYVPPRAEIPILRNCFQTIRTLGLHNTPMRIPSLGDIFQKIRRECPVLRGQLKPDGTPYTIEDAWALELIPSAPGMRVEHLVEACERFNPGLKVERGHEGDDVTKLLDRDLGPVRWVWIYRGTLPATADKHCAVQEEMVRAVDPSLRMIRTVDALIALLFGALCERVSRPAVPYAVHHQYRGMRTISHLARGMSEDNTYDHEYGLIGIWQDRVMFQDGNRFAQADWLAGVTLAEDPA